MPRAVIAIGGNSLLTDPTHPSVENQYQAARETAHHIARVAASGWELAIVHGNGPQVGFILRRSEIAHLHVHLHEIPLDVCGADTQGALGYALQQNLQNEFRDLGLTGPVVTVVTQVIVDPSDPAMSHPTKPIGSFMDEATADQRRAEGWHVVEDAGRGWRRVVPSPMPSSIVEEETIKHLLDRGTTTIAVGGGGIPVVEDSAGHLHGIAAVIDKDRAASLLARHVGAELLLISTAVEKVSLYYGSPKQVAIDSMSVAEAEAYLAEGVHFAAGSMRPKIEAAVDFLRGGGKRVVITDPANIERAAEGKAGTEIVP